MRAGGFGVAPGVHDHDAGLGFGAGLGASAAHLLQAVCTTRGASALTQKVTGLWPSYQTCCWLPAAGAAFAKHSTAAVKALRIRLRRVIVLI